MDKEKGKLRKRAQDLRVKLADPTGTIAQEIYRKNVELSRTNHTLSLLRTIDALVLKTENSLDDITKGIAQAMIDNSAYMFSAIFMKTHPHGTLPLKLSGLGIAKEGLEKLQSTDKLEDITFKFSDSWSQETGENTKVIAVNQSATKRLEEFFDGNAPSMQDVITSQNVKSICFVKLVARTKLIGVLVVGLSTPAEELNIDEVAYLGRIGESTGLAIDNKLLFEENRKVLKELKKSNEKLKALDEAKDEFISMASHQLRTPLTSVKGYVSMVLEGDAGKISGQQKQLLEQAFTSSQRMVYLIADLLNVSRLKTGKFIIESKPTYLPDVIDSEMQQLVQSAKAHNLELVFNKPASFPTLNLDETKTRQVIMNFMDNAIYYTPSGGHIHVELTATNKEIQYKVVDDGLGVPKSEQPHLFTKFFRADNARKARPDGTGLGLYMAKKVIVAQGGSLIFESQEGKGSTFGFSFPRKQLEVGNSPASSK